MSFRDVQAGGHLLTGAVMEWLHGWLSIPVDVDCGCIACYLSGIVIM